MTAEIQNLGAGNPEAFLSTIRSFEDALTYSATQGGAIDIADPDWGLSSGFTVLDNDDKGTLCGVPFIIVRTTEHLGDHGVFHTMFIVTQDGRRLIVNDGSTGISQQLARLFDGRPDLMDRPMIVRQGLRESRYVHPEHGPSVTYYLAV